MDPGPDPQDRKKRQNRMKYKKDQKAGEKLKILSWKIKENGVEGSEERIKHNHTPDLLIFYGETEKYGALDRQCS